MSNPSLLVLPILCLFFFVNRCLSDPRATEAARICSNRISPTAVRQTFVASFLESMDTVTPLISTQRYAAVGNGTGNNKVYAFGECMKDLSQTDCNLCFAQCKTTLGIRCRPIQLGTRGGRLFYDGCYLRYDDYCFFTETLSSVDRTVCATQDFVGNNTVFSTNVKHLVSNLSVVAPKNDGFSAGSATKGDITVLGWLSVGN